MFLFLPLAPADNFYEQQRTETSKRTECFITYKLHYRYKFTAHGYTHIYIYKR